MLCTPSIGVRRSMYWTNSEMSSFKFMHQPLLFKNQLDPLYFSGGIRQGTGMNGLPVEPPLFLK